MQSLFEVSKISSALPSAHRSDSEQLFTRVWPAETRRWPGFTSSLVIHLLAVLIVPPISSRIQEESDRQIWLRQERLMRTLRIRIPDHLYIASTAKPPAEAKRRTVQTPTQPAGPAQPKAAPREVEGRRAAGRRRRFELPPVQRRVESSQTIIQPQYAPDLAPTKDLRLPEVFFWSPPPAARMPPKPFVQPGHVKSPTQARSLDAPPKLEAPTGIEAGPPQQATVLDPKLLAAFGNSMPIRTSFQGQGHMGVPGDPLAGDPTTLLAISSDPLPLREFMTAPPGNQIGRTPEGGVAGGSGTGSSGSGTGGDGPGKGGGRGSGSTGSGEGASGRGAGGGSGAISATAFAHSGAVEATRISHPAGVFDVVVQSTGSTGLEGLAESAGVLSGKPIYSVFLAVGAPKEWILQYCLPLGEDQAAAVSGGVVRLGNPSPLTAPFPKLTFRPPLNHRPGTYLMLHGFIWPIGKLQELRLIGKGDPRAAEYAIAVLERWEFRPASQDGRPVQVEILLAIPGE